MADDPLILGAGPAGCAAAITLAKGGAKPTLVDRDKTPGDPLCGGFLSWRTVAQLQALGVDPLALGAEQVRELRLFTRGREARCALPAMALGLSRHALDSALRDRAVALGARMVVDTVRSAEPGRITGSDGDYASDSLFLACGKHDVRGFPRPRDSHDPALGLRLRLPASASRTRLLAGAIELHLFDGGYAGVVLQEGGSTNLCMALKKSALARHGGDPAALLESLARGSLGERLGDDWRAARIESVGAVPYGYIARSTQQGLFRLGDQAAVIPSLAGEGISIALASGQMAGQHWLAGGPAAASAYQQAFARAAKAPLRKAALARKLAESPLGARLALRAVQLWPGLAEMLARATRIDPKSRLAPSARPA